MLANSGHIPLGYYKDEKKTAATFPVIDGVRYAVPGDLASLDADGTIAVFGRGAVSINSGGEKIFPEEVEEAVKVHPAVADCLVVGVPDERFGEAVTAVVSLRPGEEATTAELVAALDREALARDSEWRCRRVWRGGSVWQHGDVGGAGTRRRERYGSTAKRAKR